MINDHDNSRLLLSQINEFNKKNPVARINNDSQEKENLNSVNISLKLVIYSILLSK